MTTKVSRRKKKRKNKKSKRAKLLAKKKAEMFPAKILDDFSNDGATIT